MLASLPMYYPPQGSLAAFWSALAGLLQQQGVDAPAQLQMPEDVLHHWLQPDLLLSQTCGYPLVHTLKDRVQVVGTLAYEATGAQGIHCQSQLICRATDARRNLAAWEGSTVAYNARDSQSGYNALRHSVALASGARPFYARTLATGAHLQSVEYVRTGRADMAAIDAVTWALFQRTQPVLSRELAVFGQTQAYPGLPLITSVHTPPEVLAVLQRSLHTISTEARFAAVRAPLLICGFEATQLADYRVCATMERETLARGLAHWE